MKETIQNIIKDNDYNVIESEGEDLKGTTFNTEEFFNELNNQDITHFYVQNLENNDDNWLQADYYCELIGHTITIDNDVQDSFESVDAILKFIVSMNERIADINGKLTK